MLLQYAPTLYVSSPTIKSFAVKFTTASLLKKEKESCEEILMRKFWPLATTSHNLLRFNIVDKYLFKQHFWYTAVSTKVVPEKCKSVRDNVDWHCG